MEMVQVLPTILVLGYAAMFVALFGLGLFIMCKAAFEIFKEDD